MSVLLALPLLTACGATLDSRALQLAGHLLRPVLQRDRCPRLARIDASQPPQQLYMAMSACLRRSDPETAVVLFSLAAAYGRYDALRVADPSAHQAAGILRLLALQRLRGAERQELTARVEALGSDPGRLLNLCATLERIGPPRYQPDYMLAHGLAAVRRGLVATPAASPRRGPALVDNFDPAAAWNQVLDRNVGCSRI